MSKFLTTSFILLISSVAIAIPSYWAAIETLPYEKATRSGEADKDKYAGYYCTVETALSTFGDTTVSAIETYLNTGDNFATIRGKATYDSVAFSDGEYHILDYTSEAFKDANYVAIAFYGNEAYRVYGLNSGVLMPYGRLVLNESNAASGTVGEWTANVPEPTSGLLLLLGAAGLALLRKRRPVDTRAAV